MMKRIVLILCALTAPAHADVAPAPTSSALGIAIIVLVVALIVGGVWWSQRRRKP